MTFLVLISAKDSDETYIHAYQDDREDGWVAYVDEDNDKFAYLHKYGEKKKYGLIFEEGKRANYVYGYNDKKKNGFVFERDHDNEEDNKKRYVFYRYSGEKEDGLVLEKIDGELFIHGYNEKKKYGFIVEEESDINIQYIHKYDEKKKYGIMIEGDLPEVYLCYLAYNFDQFI